MANKSQSLAEHVVSLLRAWWRQDRVRSSPREGRLLRLAPGAILSIHGEMLEVEQRTVIRYDKGQVVRLKCRFSGGTSELWIQVEPFVMTVWHKGDDEYNLMEDEIEVWRES